MWRMHNQTVPESLVISRNDYFKKLRTLAHPSNSHQPSLCSLTWRHTHPPRISPARLYKTIIPSQAETALHRYWGQEWNWLLVVPQTHPQSVCCSSVFKHTLNLSAAPLFCLEGSMSTTLSLPLSNSSSSPPIISLTKVGFFPLVPQLFQPSQGTLTFFLLFFTYISNSPCKYELKQRDSAAPRATLPSTPRRPSFCSLLRTPIWPGRLASCHPHWGRLP